MVPFCVRVERDVLPLGHCAGIGCRANREGSAWRAGAGMQQRHGAADSYRKISVAVSDSRSVQFSFFQSVVQFSCLILDYFT